MRIVIIGVGGVGGYFGGKLTQVGFDVTFLTRGKTLEAIKNNGLEVKSFKGNFKVYPKVTDSVKTIKDTPDLVILGVKSWQVVEVAQQIKPIVGKNTLVSPLQNGADNADKLLSVLPKENVLAGLCRIVSKIESLGVINHFGFEPEIIFGELNNAKTERVLNIKKAFDKAGFSNKISDDIFVDIWIKFMFITTYSGIGALTRAEIGAVLKIPYLRQIMVDTADEILKIAQAKNINLTQKDADNAMHVIDHLSPETTASMQRDVMEGKPSELDNFNGYIVRQGKAFGIETPMNTFIYNCLLPQENNARNSI